MDKIKIGKIANMITNIIFVIWIVFIIGTPAVGIKNYLIICGVLVVLFAISVIVGHVCLKDYKEEQYTESSDEK